MIDACMSSLFHHLFLFRHSSFLSKEKTKIEAFECAEAGAQYLTEIQTLCCNINNHGCGSDRHFRVYSTKYTLGQLLRNVV